MPLYDGVVNNPPPQSGSSGVTVLEWDGDVANVYHGAMWPTSRNLPTFLYEFWCKVGNASGNAYLISEGYGGAHAILAGFTSGRVPTGNIWTGSTSTSFSGDYTAEVGEWLHYAVGWDGSSVYVLINGVVVGITAFSGPRQAQQGSLFIGGSDHNNWVGGIAQVRGFEGPLPLTLSSSALVVDRHFGQQYGAGESGRWAQFLADYTTPAAIYPDQSEGYAGRLHTGRTTGGQGAYGGVPARVPARVVDASAPFHSQVAVARTRTAATAASVPGGAKIFDSFGGADSLLAFTDSPTLGATEGGTLGTKTWLYGTAGGSATKWGVFDGRAVCFSVAYATAFVQNDSADMDVRVDRRLTQGLSRTGLCFRSDGAGGGENSFRVFASSSTQVTMYRPNGTSVTYTPSNGTWTTVRASASGTTITLYVDNGAGGWETLATLTGETLNQTSTYAGLFHWITDGTAARYDNFTVI